MTSALYNFPFIKHANLIGIFDRRKTVGDCNRGTRLHQSLQRLLHQTFRFSIQCRSSLIQNQNGRILQNSTGDTNTLSLTTGKFAATVTNIRIISFRLLHNKIMGIGNLSSFYNLLHSCIFYAKSNIIEKCIIKKNGFLIHITDQTS